MSTVLIIQHVVPEPAGVIAEVLGLRDLECHVVRVFAGEPVPQIGSARALVVMGGPMSAYEESTYPHLVDEKRLIAEALGAGLPVLGVCLGSQILASVLGAPVTAGPSKEIGWLPVSLLPEAAQDPLFREEAKEFPAFIWHGDVFELPEGAHPLARSQQTPLQAFRHGDSAYGILFHLEADLTQVERMAVAFQGELHQAGVNGDDLVVQARVEIAELRARGLRVFGRWADLIR
jgi:GMP synthase (glutamine-hydrolysing)